MKVEKLLDKLAITHDRACRSLDKFHRYTAGTTTSSKAWDAHCRASEAFAATLSELRAALGVMGTVKGGE